MMRQFNSGRLLTLVMTVCVCCLAGCGDVTMSFAESDVAAPQDTERQIPDSRDKIKAAQQLIAEGKLAEAEDILAEVVLQQNPLSASAWMLLGHVRHGQGKLDAALEAHLMAAKFPRVKAAALYNAACAYSLKGEPNQAFDHLQQAIAAGFSDPILLATDADLANIREDERFAAITPEFFFDEDAFVEPARILQTFNGETTNSEFGWVARKIGDVDGDNVIDFISTAPGFSSNAGKVYAYSSKTGKLLFSRTGQPGQRYGNGAAGAGDVNADGTPDVIIGGPSSEAGMAEVLSGKDGSVLLTLKGATPSENFGYKVGGMGDLNGDGHDDVVVTALAAHGKESGSGRCFGYSGKDGELLFELDGETSGDKFGSAVVVSTDPQHRILAVGAQDAGAGKRGRVYVYTIEGTTPQHAFTIEADPTGKDLGQMFLSFPGDLNSDGTPDLFCSDFVDSAGGPGVGRFFVYSCADGEKLLDVKGTQPGEGLGTSISDAGDANGDGIGDLIVGAWQNREGAQSGGKVYLYSGADGSLLTAWTCKQQGDTFGFDAQGIGDVDGDGRVDFLLTSAWSAAHGPKTGRVFIFAGPELSEQQK